MRRLAPCLSHYRHHHSRSQSSSQLYRLTTSFAHSVSMDIASATSAIINSRWKRFIPIPNPEEVILLVQENIANPLLWSLLVKPDIPQVTYRIRKYVLSGDAKEAWRLKDSFKDTFALEAVSVRFFYST